MCEPIIACARNGGSAKLRATEIGIHIATYLRWIDPNSDQYHEDFHQAHELAEQLCYAWWEKMGTAHLVINGKDSPRLDPQVYRLNMMNRFGWGEKREETRNDTTVTLNFGDAQPTDK